MNYAKTALSLWKMDAKVHTELPLLSLFMQVNEGESDLMASWDEIEVLIPFIEPKKDDFNGGLIAPEKRAKNAFENYQEGNFLNFR